MPRLSAATVNKRLDLARRVIDEATRRGAMAGPNPVLEIVRPRDPKREQMVLSEPELRRLIDAADTVELRALVRCFCELALRFSEAIGLPIAAYDHKQRTVRIRRQAAECRQPKPMRMVIKEYAKTPWGIRTLRVSEALAAELDAIVARQGETPNPHGLFFTDARGGILREPNFLRDRWRPLLRRAGFVETTADGKLRARKGLTPDVGRHSRASLIASRHSELFAPKLQRFLGHHSVPFTLVEYGSHFSHGMLEPEEYLTDVDVAEWGDPAAALAPGRSRARRESARAGLHPRATRLRSAVERLVGRRARSFALHPPWPVSLARRVDGARSGVRARGHGGGPRARGVDGSGTRPGG